MDTAEKKVILKVENLSLTFGKVAALSDVSLEVYDGEILSVIGPNGAGKTSLLNCLSGFYRPDRGRIAFDGQEITNMPTHKRAEAGIARTFQGIQLYLGMTALDNIMSGRHIHMRTNFIQNALYWVWSDREETDHRLVAEDIIDFLEMEAIRDRVVGSLGYGLRKRVDLGRALALEPKILIMDEPMAGMNVEEKEDMARFILDIQEAKKIPVVLVEHDMEVVTDISNRVAVLDWGFKIAEGRPEEIMRNPSVIKAYIGEE
ncbi:MAG: ABC transporter ATP-binding protein [Proteobacteria bacterium]|nr:ABC transporter ATP-binding protein [Pseudomonadota bacterium]